MIQAICFDAFGTLVEITDKRRPFRALLRGGVTSITAEEVLTRPLSLREVAARVGHTPGEGGLAELEADLQAERASVRLRPGIAEIWQTLRERGLRIAVCSNLALPYGEPLLSALPGYSGRRDPLLRRWAGETGSGHLPSDLRATGIAASGDPICR
jgi:FMN phosphatase YigB (HAD superfamily)